MAIGSWVINTNWPEEIAGGPVEFYEPKEYPPGVSAAMCRAMRWTGNEDRQLAVRGWLATVGKTINIETVLDDKAEWQITGESYNQKDDYVHVTVQNMKTGMITQIALEAYAKEFGKQMHCIRPLGSSGMMLHFGAASGLPVVLSGEWIAFQDKKMLGVFEHKAFIAKWKAKQPSPALDVEAWFGKGMVAEHQKMYAYPQKFVMGFDGSSPPPDDMVLEVLQKKAAIVGYPSQQVYTDAQIITEKLKQKLESIYPGCVMLCPCHECVQAKKDALCQVLNTTSTQKAQKKISDITAQLDKLTDLQKDNLTVALTKPINPFGKAPSKI